MFKIGSHSDISGRSLLLVAACGAIGLVGLSGRALALDRINTGNALAEPIDNYAFVRDATGKKMPDFDYAARVLNAMNNGPKWGSTDIVMQQCFGGGFVNDISGQLGALNYTLATATNWNQPALNTDEPDPTRGNLTRRVVDNFTRPWRADADMYTASGMRTHFTTAANGLAAGAYIPAIPKEPYSPATSFPGAVENPQYVSPDAPGGGANGNRVIGGANQYAIIVGWDAPDADTAPRTPNRHKINMERIYSTLRNTYNIPAANIVTLYGSPAVAIQAPTNGAGPDDFGGLGGIPNVQKNELSQWDKALAGQLFGAAPPAGAKLLIYNSGHGDHARDARAIINQIIQAIPGGARYRIPISDGFNVDPVMPIGMTDDSGMDSLELSFQAGADSYIDTSQLVVNNAVIGSLGAFKVTSPGDVDPMDPFVNDPIVQYRIPVAHTLLGSDPSATNIDLMNFSVGFDSGTFLAANFAGGEQGYLVYVPEPGSLTILVVGAVLLGAQRRAQRRGARQ